jgi:hypothetical protein
MHPHESRCFIFIPRLQPPTLIYAIQVGMSTAIFLAKANLDQVLN